MKKLMKSLMLFAAAAMALTSCENEAMNEGIEANDTYTMTFVAGAPESKTSVDIANNIATFSWAEEGETFTFVQNTAEGLKKGTDVTFNNNEGLAEITATFTEATSPIVAVYPEAAWVTNENTNYNKIKLIVPSDQTILNGTFDPNADLLVSREVAPENTTDTHLLEFARLVAVGKMTIKNLPIEGTEVIEKVKFSIDSENALSGRLYIDLATAEVSEWGYNGQANNYVNLVEGNVTAAAENEFFFTCMPATVAAGETFTVEVTTNVATYTHSVTIPEGKSIDFTSGRVSAFGVNMQNAERVENTAIALPWTESFDNEEAVSKYDTTNGGGTTEFYSESVAGGTKGEILIARNEGSMTATIASDGTAKTLYFWFKSNKDFIEVSSATENVTINKVNSKYYTITLAEGVKQFKLTLTNNNSSNARVDDIVLTTEAPAIESITLDGATTSFTVGDTFTYEGLTVTAVYSNGATEDVTASATVDSSAVKMDTADDYTVTVTYEGKTATYTITVNEEPQDDDVVAEGWYLVEDASTLAVGDKIVITNQDATYAISTNQKNNNREAKPVTKNANNNTITIDSNIQEIELKAGNSSGTFAFYVTGTNTGYLYAGSSSGNQLKTKATLDNHGSWTISISNGVASIQAKQSSNRNVMQYNYNSGTPLFACYASASQTALAIYKYVSGGSETPDPTPDPEDIVAPTITIDNISDVTAAGVANATQSVGLGSPVGNWTYTVTSEATWLSNMSLSENNVIYTVAANNSDARTATVTITASCDGQTDVTKTFTISQLAGESGEETTTWTRVTDVNTLLAGGTFIIGYENETSANSGIIVPLRSGEAGATTTANGYFYSGTTSGSSTSSTINMTSVSDTSAYEVTISASTTVSGAINIQMSTGNYFGNNNSKNTGRLYTSPSANTAYVPTFGANDVVTLKCNAAASYHTLQYNTGSPRFANYSGTQKNVVIYKKN